MQHRYNVHSAEKSRAVQRRLRVRARQLSGQGLPLQQAFAQEVGNASVYCCLDEPDRAARVLAQRLPVIIVNLVTLLLSILCTLQDVSERGIFPIRHILPILT